MGSHLCYLPPGRGDIRNIFILSSAVFYMTSVSHYVVYFFHPVRLIVMWYFTGHIFFLISIQQIQDNHFRNIRFFISSCKFCIVLFHEWCYIDRALMVCGTCTCFDFSSCFRTWFLSGMFFPVLLFCFIFSVLFIHFSTSIVKDVNEY